MSNVTTTQEFLDMIKVAGGGRPIDISRFTTSPLMDMWRYDKAHRGIDYCSSKLIDTKHPVEIQIYDIDKVNPPLYKSDIYFLKIISESVRERISEIPDDISNELVSKLVFKEPLERVLLPSSIVEGLHGLQREPTNYEWGGGIDFEIVKGMPYIERLLAYFGDVEKVPWRVIKKYGNDVEVLFHTHPNRKLANPSKNDILTFINAEQKVEIIVSKFHILILYKTKNTPTSLEKSDIYERTPDIGYVVHNYRDQKEALEKMRKEYKINYALFVYPNDVVIDLEVVKKVLK